MERDRIETPKRGRPRDPEATAAIHDAAIALCREVGYDAVTIEAIASRAGVGKATVYRWWPSKELVVADALRDLIQRIPVPDTGSTEGDLAALLGITVRLYQDEATLPLLSGLVAAMHRSRPIADAVLAGFGAAWPDVARVVVLRGLARGDLEGDPEILLDLLAGPLFLSAIWYGRPLDDAYARSILRHLLRGITAR